MKTLFKDLAVFFFAAMVGLLFGTWLAQKLWPINCVTDMECEMRYGE